MGPCPELRTLLHTPSRHTHQLTTFRLTRSRYPLRKQMHTARARSSEARRNDCGTEVRRHHGKEEEKGNATAAVHSMREVYCKN